jgi:hypothetical protein
VFAISVGNSARAIPELALIAIVVAFVGFGFLNVAIALMVLGIPPILTNAYVGVRQVDRDAVEAARGMGMSDFGIITRVEMPLAVPTIMSGVRTASINIIATATIAPLAGVVTLGDFIINRNLERYTSTIHRHPGPFYYYLPILVIGLFPWGALFPFAVADGVAGGLRKLRQENRGTGFLLCWILLPLAFFSFAGSKLPSYLLPCFPAMAILTADAWGKVLEDPRAPRRRFWGTVCLLALFPVLAGAIYAWCRSEAPEQIRAQTPLALCLAGTAAALAALSLAKRHRLLFAGCAAGTVVSLTALVVFSLGNVREQASLTRIAGVGVRLAKGGKTVVAYRNFHNYLYFYTENRVLWVKRLPQLEQLLDEQGSVYCFLEKAGLKELSQTSLQVEPLDRQYTVVLARVSRPAPPGGVPEGSVPMQGSGEERP